MPPSYGAGTCNWGYGEQGCAYMCVRMYMHVTCMCAVLPAGILGIRTQKHDLEISNIILYVFCACECVLVL